jgi:hypothetical protein
MEAEATDAFDISREPESVRQMYGILSTVVSFLWPEGWLSVEFALCRSGRVRISPGDGREYLASSHKLLAAATDKAIAALLTDPPSAWNDR